MSREQATSHVNNDEEVKFLFQNVSPRLLIYLLNYVFQENISPDEHIVIKTNEELIDVMNFSSIFCDFLIETKEHGRFHIEVQTKDETLMSIRMAKYALALSEKNKYTKDNTNFVEIIFPKQCILYINENPNIKREMIRLKLPNEMVMEYEVKVIKTWDLENSISQEDLYILIPFILANMKLYTGKENIQTIVNLYDRFLDVLAFAMGKQKLEEDDLKLLFESMERLIYRNCEKAKMKEEQIEEVKMSMGMRYESKYKGPFTEFMDKWRLAENRIKILEEDKVALEHDKVALEHDKIALEYDKAALEHDNKNLKDEVKLLQEKLKQAGLM